MPSTKQPWTQYFRTISPFSTQGRSRWWRFILASGPAAQSTMARQSGDASRPGIQINPNSSCKQTPGAWSFMAKVTSSLAATIGLINTAFLIWMATSTSSSSGMQNLFSGSCSTVRLLDTAAHVAINVLSTLLLVASNYTMQCLVAPTRDEVTAAHSAGRWLHIGRLSLRNVTSMKTPKLLLWIMLSVSSLPLHLLYNSAVFASLQANEYVIAVVNDQFLRGAPLTCSPYWVCTDSLIEPLQLYYNYSSITLLKLQQDAMAGNLQFLDKKDCINAYGTQLVTGRSHVVVVSNVTTTIDYEGRISNNTLLGVGVSSPWYAATDFVATLEPKNGSYYATPFSTLNSGMRWICPPLAHNGRESIPCTLSMATQDIDNWNVLNSGFPAEYCLSQVVPEECKLQGSIPIMVVVTVFNFIKAFCMLLAIWWSKEPILATMGDAVVSFLEREDPPTAGQCLLSRSEFEKSFKGRPDSKIRLPKKFTSRSRRWYDSVPWMHRGRSELEKNSKGHPSAKIRQPKKYTVRSRHWYNSVTRVHWAACMVPCVAVLACAGWLLWEASNGKMVQLRSIPTIWNSGFGSTNLSEYVSFTLIESTLISVVLVANAPQLVCSILYLQYNGIFTCMLSAREWSLLAEKPAGMRVSKPRGQQRMTYWLSLPYRYSIPLIVASTILHLLISQSIFLMHVMVYNLHGQYVPDAPVAGYGFYSDMYHPGYSLLALFATVIFGVFLLLAVLLISCRKMDGRVPAADGCSWIISAACHAPGEGRDATAELQWGAVKVMDDDGAESWRCCINSAPVTPPIAGDTIYA